jgi:hypothetical protein
MNLRTEASTQFRRRSLCVERRILAALDGEKKAFWTANERIAALVKPEKLVGGPGNADADGFSDWSRGTAGFAKPEGTMDAKVEAVVTAIDLKSGGEASGAAREIKKLTGFAVALHEFNAIEGFERADEDGRSDSGRFANDVQHEVRAVIEKNIGMAGLEIHRTNARSRAAKMMPGGIARWISFRLHDAAAQATRGKIVDNHFSDEEASQLDGVRRKFGPAEAVDCEFRRGGFQSFASRGHGMANQRDGFCKSSEETRP